MTASSQAIRVVTSSPTVRVSLSNWNEPLYWLQPALPATPVSANVRVIGAFGNTDCGLLGSP
jgi:hypothetical protein